MSGDAYERVTDLAISCRVTLFAAVVLPMVDAMGWKNARRQDRADPSSGRCRFAGIVRFSSVIEGAQESDQQHQSVDFDGHFS
jgi:hypothetical protein